MATQSPAKKRPKLSLKWNRKVQNNTEEISQDGTKDSKDTSEYHQFDEQCEVPEEPREMPAPYCGLYNLGNTCYFNSVLQALRYTPGFCEGLKMLADVVEDYEESGSSSSSDSKSSKHTDKQDPRSLLNLVLKLNKGCLSQGWIKCRSGEHRSQEMTRKIEEIVTLENEERRGRKEKEEKKEELFDEMSAKESKFLSNPSPDIDMAIYPDEVLSAIRELNPMFQGYLQHDSQELLCSLLSKLQDASQKVLQIAADNKETPKRNKHSKLSLSASRNASGQSTRTDNQIKVDSVTSKTEKSSSDEHVNEEKAKTTPEVINGQTNHSSTSVSSSESNASEKKNANITSNGSGEGRRRKRTSSSSRDSEADGDQTPQRKVKKKARSLTPSNDSVVKSKGTKSLMANGDHCVNGNDSNGKMDQSENVNGGGDTNGKTGKESKLSKKKRLGVGRIKVPFNQPTILSKFGFVKKDSTPANGIDKTLLCNGDVVNGKDAAPKTSHKIPNGKCETLSEVKNKTPLVCYNQTNNNSNQTQPHVPNSPKKTSKQLQNSKSDSKISPSKKTNNSKTTTPTNDKKKGCLETAATTKEDEVECLGTVSSLDRQLKIVEKMFHGSLVLRTRCMECEGFTERREDFQEISVPVQRMEVGKMSESDEDEQVPGRPNNLSLSWALSEFACAEKLTAENKYFCESCRHHTEAERTMLFGSLPPVLSVQLKRFCAFSGSLAFGGVSKVNDHLATPLSLCLTQWCTKQCRQRRQKYSLYAVVMHSGVSSSSGHYVCYVKIPARQIPSTEITEFDEDCDSNTEVWGHFDDERVTIFSDHEFSQVLHPINGTMTTATPYLLFYRRAVEEI